MELDGDPDAAEWLVGFYDDEDAYVCVHDGFTFARALEIATWMQNALDARADLWDGVMRTSGLNYTVYN